MALSIDNCDRLEETPSGGGTPHRVNGLIVQPVVFGQQPLTDVMNESKHKHKTTKAVQSQLPICNASARVGPLPSSYIQVNARELKQVKYKTTVFWLITRLHCTENCYENSLTRFNIQVRNRVDVT